MDPTQNIIYKIEHEAQDLTPQIEYRALIHLLKKMKCTNRSSPRTHNGKCKHTVPSVSIQCKMKAGDLCTLHKSRVGKLGKGAGWGMSTI